MKKAIKIFCLIFLFVTMLPVSTQVSTTGEINTKIASAEESNNQNSEKLSEEDWKIELNENTQKGSKEFDFIQKNLASSDLADNGHFLLITGIILVVLAVSGIIFFSFCLYKLCRNTKKRLKSKGARYK